MITYKIHPAIGIARVGNGEKWFIGPESLEPASQPAYKSEPGRIRRQASRFRLWKYVDGMPAREVTSADGEIVWRVHLANRKAALSRRNKDVAQRTRLVIDAGQVTISGKNRGPFELAGSFQGKSRLPQEVLLGEVRTDEEGRLIVLGGRGKSFSPTGAPVNDYCDNDDWCDDTSDGPVRASLWLKDGNRIEAESAWVVAAPPKYAPSILDPCTLFDRVYQEMVEMFGYEDPLLAQEKVSFRWHIYPILERAVHQHWVRNAMPRDYLDPEVFKDLKGKNAGDKRQKVYDELLKILFLPDWRRKVLERWRQGAFEADWEKPCEIPVPFALDKAALDHCLGSILGPGLEAPIHCKGLYHAPFRIRQEGAVEPGSLTESLSVPWQADFWGCQEAWAPTVPSRIYINEKETREWDHGVVEREQMVDCWRLMGYALSAQGNGKHPFVEKERDLEHG